MASKTEKDIEGQARRGTVNRAARLIVLCEAVVDLLNEESASDEELVTVLPGYEGEEEDLTRDIIFLVRAIQLLNFSQYTGLDVDAEVERLRVVITRVQ